MSVRFFSDIEARSNNSSSPDIQICRNWKTMESVIILDVGLELLGTLSI